jgi:site-specific DNA-methyltransferase (adenine-specific)
MIIREEIIGNQRLILGDCLTVMPLLGKVDAVVTDSPYGIAFSHGGGGGKLARSTRLDHKPIIGDDVPFDPAPLLALEVPA